MSTGRPDNIVRPFPAADRNAGGTRREIRLPQRGHKVTLWPRANSYHVDLHAGTRNPAVVPGPQPLFAQAVAVYWMDPHVVVFRSSAMGCGVVGLSSQGAGPDLYSRAPGFRPVVLDTPGDGPHGMARVRGVSQPKKSAAKTYLALRYAPRHSPLLRPRDTPKFGASTPPNSRGNPGSEAEPSCRDQFARRQMAQMCALSALSLPRTAMVSRDAAAGLGHEPGIASTGLL